MKAASIHSPRTLAFIALATVLSCSSQDAHGYRADKTDKGYDQTNTAARNEPSGGADDMSVATSDGCNPSLWTHVYNPSRLQQIKTCMTATGTIDESNAEDDGDQHLLLRLDPGQDALLKKKNRTKKNGDLVIEIVCANPVKLRKVRAACTGYANQIRVPVLGSHVKVTGTYVIDTHNGWAEIHPVSQIQVVK